MRFKLATLAVVTLAGSLNAQETPTYTLGAWVGIFLPTADLMSDQLIQQPGSGLNSAITFKQQTSAALGLRGSRAINSKLAVELEFFWASSSIELDAFRTGIDRTQTTTHARVIVLSANAVYEVFRAPFTPFAVYVLGGIGLISRGGDFFDSVGGFLGGIDGGSRAALILGGGFRYGVSSRVGLRLDIRDHISSYAQSLEGQDLDSELQNDFVISVGLEYGVGR